LPFESCEGAAFVVELGTALVSDLELSDPGEVVVEEEGPVFVSFLLDSWGAGLPVDIPVSGFGAVLGAVAVSALVAGAGALRVLVAAFVVSLLGVSLARLQPVRTSGRASTEATMAREEAGEDSFIGVVWFLVGFLLVVSPLAPSLGDTPGGMRPLSQKQNKRCLSNCQLPDGFLPLWALKDLNLWPPGP
jgi:hypothetical protein